MGFPWPFPGLDFAIYPQARRYVRPNRVRHPTDCEFASGCSPPRLMATQLPSATGSGHLPEGDFHPSDRACFPGARMPAFAGMTNPRQAAGNAPEGIRLQSSVKKPHLGHLGPFIGRCRLGHFAMTLGFKLGDEHTAFPLTELFTYEQVPWPCKTLRICCFRG